MVPINDVKTGLTSTVLFNTFDKLRQLAIVAGKKDEAKKVINILLGKDSVNDSVPMPSPYSDDAKRQAAQFTFHSWGYADDPRYQDGKTKTPIEELLENMNF